MDLAAFDTPEAEAALAQIGCDPAAHEMLLASCGESLAEIWLRRGAVTEAIRTTLAPVARTAAEARLRGPVPETFAQWTIEREGEAGRAWLATLPALVAEMAQRWGVAFDASPSLHGGISLVLLGRRDDMPCALKVGWVDSTTLPEAIALRAWDGNGAVRLLDADPARGALLLERLDPARSLTDLPLSEQLPIAAGLLRRLSITAPDGLEPLRDTAAALADGLPDRWERAGRPFPRPVVERAVGLAQELGASAGNRLVHGDFHPGNILAGAREPWLATDPKPVAGDPEYALGPLVWRALDAMEASGGLGPQLDSLIHDAGLDRERTRGWLLVRCVDYGLWGLSVGLTYDPARCARIADYLSP